MRFDAAYCIKEGSVCRYKRAVLIVEGNEYIIKFALKTLDTLNACHTVAKRIPNYMMIYKGIKFTDGEKSYNLYFSADVAEKLYSFLSI